MTDLVEYKLPHSHQVFNISDDDQKDKEIKKGDY